MLSADIPLRSVVVQAGSNATYRVVAIDEAMATVVRCTPDNVISPGSPLRQVPMQQFQEWSAFDGSIRREPHPDDF